MSQRKGSILIAIVLSILCIGCGRTHTEIKYVEKPVYIEVPVMKTPEIEPIKKPVYYIKRIDSESTPAEVVEAYINTIKELNNYIRKLKLAIEPFIKVEK